MIESKEANAMNDQAKMTNDQESTVVDAVTVDRLRTHCCECKYPFRIGRSLSMRMGMNSGHVTCPRCNAFLHVEQLEGDEASTELWEKYVARETRGPSFITQSMDQQ